MLPLLRIEMTDHHEVLAEDRGLDKEVESQEDEQVLVHHVLHERSQNLIVRLSVFVV
jgi:hypothetical protein